MKALKEGGKIYLVTWVKLFLAKPCQGQRVVYDSPSL